MSNRYPLAVRQQNEILSAELGANPRYAWRWSEDLWHVLEVLDLDGNPIYVQGRSPAGLIVMMPKTATKKLLPEHHNQWVICALVEINSRDGSVQGTGNGAWVPLSSASGVVCLPENEMPSKVFTESVIDAVREHRSVRPRDLDLDWEERERKREKDRWNRIYDEIRDASTAFANLPGLRGNHVSFGGFEEPKGLIN